MTHIEVLRFSEPPCGGQVVAQPLPPAQAGRRRSLPLYGAKEPELPTEEWVCQGCGRTWPREPRLDEAL
jgi:hypothetical protein